MFREEIVNSPFVGGYAEEAFKNISASNPTVSRDVSFLTTLRALVASRINADEKLTFTYVSYNFLSGETDLTPMFHAADNYRSNVDGCHIIVQSVYGSEVGNKFEKIEIQFEERYKDFHRLNKVTDFFRKSFPVLCFINPEEKTTWIFTPCPTVAQLHYLQCAIPAVLPWYFKGNTLNETEMQLINSLRKTKADEYRRCIDEIALSYDLKTLKIKSMLEGFETSAEKNQRDNLSLEIRGYYDKITQYNNSISALLQTVHDKEIALLGLESKIQNGRKSEIMEYFLCNNKLTLESVAGHTMTFSCKDYLTYYDEEMAEQMIKNENGFVYRPEGRNYTPESREDMEKLMRAIFIERKLRIKFCATYTLSIRGGVSAISHYRYGGEFSDCMPNPHLDIYSCMGNYSPAINELLTERDYIGAIEQCIASCKSLNFADTTVMSKFMERLYKENSSGVNTRCIELPNGDIVKPSGAIRWLNKNRQEEENNE